MRAIIILVFLLAATVGAYAYYRITKKANKDKEEAIQETKKIEVKNAALRIDSLKLVHSIDSIKAKKRAVTVNSADTFKIKHLSDSINNLNKTIGSLYDHSNIYSDSIISLVNTIVKYKDIEKTLKISYDNLQSEKDNLEVENKKLKESGVPDVTPYKIREKGYISKLNSLEQRINLLQRNRDSLASIVADYKQKRSYINDEPIVDEKKRIFGYGYDYHNYKQQSKKN